MKVQNFLLTLAMKTTHFHQDRTSELSIFEMQINCRLDLYIYSMCDKVHTCVVYCTHGLKQCQRYDFITSSHVFDLQK